MHSLGSVQFDDEEIREHKCFNCPWGKWCGTKFVCMFTRCLKGLRPIYTKEENNNINRNKKHQERS